MFAKKPEIGLKLKTASQITSLLYGKYQLQPYNPDKLYQKRGGYDIFDDMREDDQISAVLHLKKLMVIDNDWDIISDDEKIKEFIKKNLIENLDGLFEKCLYNILSAMDYGFSLTEKVFKIENNKVFLRALKTRPPHSFYLYLDKFGNIEKIVQDTETGEIEIDAKNFMHYAYQQEFDNPYGQSELNAGVYRAWWSKVAIIKFWNIYLERFGMPTTVGKYPVNMAKYKDDLINVLKNLQAKTAITVPEGIDIEFLDAGLSGRSGFESAINHYNTAIARKMLIPDLLGFSGKEISGGSFALGKEHFGIFYSVIEQIRKELERLINNDIVKKLVEWNFSNGNAEFKFSAVDDYKKEKDLNLFLELLKTGQVSISDEQKNWFYKQIDIPESKPKQEPKQEPKPTDMQALKMKSPKLNKFESFFNKMEKKYSELLSDDFNVIINSLWKTIIEKNIIKNKKFREINDLKLKFMNRPKKTIKEMFKEAWEYGQKTAIKKYEIEYNFGMTNEETIEWLEYNAIYVSTMEAGFILGKVKPILAEGMRQGLGTNKIVKMIENQLDYSIGSKRLKIITRTNTTKMINESRMQIYRHDKNIKGYYYSAIIDNRTSEVCLALDSGAQGIYSKQDIENIIPPNHFQCRSVVVPVYDLESEKIASGIPGELEPEAGDFYKIRKE